MKRLCAVLIVLTIALTASASFADTTSKMTVSVSGGPISMDMTMVLFIKGMKGRTDIKMAVQGMAQDQSMLLDVTTKQMLMLDNVNKTVTNFDPQAMMAAMPLTFGEMSVSVKPTGETKEVLGRKCAGYAVQITIPMTVANESVTMTMSGPAWITKEGPGVEEYQAFSKASSSSGMMMMNPLAQGPQAKAMQEMAKTFADAGVVLLQEMQMSVQGSGQLAQMMAQMNMTVTTKVTEISTDPIPDDKFQVPESYTKK